MLLTEESIRQLEVTGKRYTVSDTLTPGLQVVVNGSGAKHIEDVYVFEGKKYRENLGDFPGVDLAACRRRCEQRREATRSAQRAKRLVVPVARNEEDDRHLMPLFMKYDKLHISQKSPNTQLQYRQIMREVVEDFVLLSALRPVRIQQVMDDKADTPVQANRWLTVLKHFCKFLQKRGYMEHNPAAAIDKYPERPKDRIIPDAHIVSFSAELYKPRVKWDTRTPLQVLFCTGTRLSEAAGLLRPELSEPVDDVAEWSITRERTKARRNFMTYLPDTLADNILHRTAKRRLPPNEACFRGRPDSLRHFMHRACDRAGIPHYTPHDIRRTVNTLLAREAVSPEVRARFLNHAAQGVTDRHYNVYDYAEEKKQAARIIHSKMREFGIID